MDGKDMLRRLRMLLGEGADSRFMDRQTSFDYLYEAAKEYVRMTNCLTAYQDITTVEDQTDYLLNGDYMGLYLQDPDSFEFFVRFYDASGSSYDFLPWKQYGEIAVDLNTDSVAIPSYFSIKEYETLASRLTGTATSNGTHSGGKARLTDSAAAFAETYTTPGDMIHNATQGYSGVVIGIASTTGLDTAMFDSSGDEASWTSADAYILTPRGRMVLVLDPPPSTAGDTVRVWYVQKPDPVYSDYDVYRIPGEYAEALVRYAAFLYKYRDREPNYGDALYVYWIKALRQHISQHNHMNVRDFAVIPKIKR